MRCILAGCSELAHPLPVRNHTHRHVVCLDIPAYNRSGGMRMASEMQQKIEQFFRSYPLKNYKKGQILVYADDAPQGVFFIESGDVRQYVISNSGDEVVVNVFKPPAFFPMSWVLNRTPNNYFFETASDTKLRIAPAEDTLTFIQNNPDVLQDLLARVYRGVDVLLRRMTHLMKGNARTRTILELIIACHYFGKKHGDGYIVKIPETELAARSGLTRETISRELHKLHKKGLLVIGHKHITINSIDQLEYELNNGL